MARVKTPRFLSRWADEHGIARRTAYDRFHKGQLEVRATRLPSGAIVVLDDDDPGEQVHPFTAAYASTLHLPVQKVAGDLSYSPLLDAWGCSLYEAVRPELRPLVVGLAGSAAAHYRGAQEQIGWRLLDFIAHVDLPAWYRGAGQLEAAEMLEARGEISDQETFNRLWPTVVFSHQWRDELDEAAAKVRRAAQTAPAPAAVAALANQRFGIESTTVLVQRMAGQSRSTSQGILDGRLRQALEGNLDLPDGREVRLNLWDLRACYSDSMATIGVTACRQAAHAACRVAGWELEASAPPSSHDAFRIAFEAVTAAEEASLSPHLTASHLREVVAFHCIATGQAFERTGPNASVRQGAQMFGRERS
jgi:hypothetical protein